MLKLTLGQTLRRLRQQRGLSLTRLADRAGCAKSFLSAIEHDQKRASEELLARVEAALGIDDQRLIEASRYSGTHPSVREHVDELEQSTRLARRLAELCAGGIDEGGRVSGSLDRAFRTGELRRLIERIAPDSPADQPEPVSLAMEVPLINSVAAGYPREFTDMGYPARVADEYVRCPDLADADAFAARVVGDSMSPDYREGDVVIFSPALDVRSGMDCFARLEPDHETTFKRVYLETSDDGGELIRLQPTNPAYPPRVLPRERVAGLYAAVNVLRRVAQP